MSKRSARRAQHTEWLYDKTGVTPLVRKSNTDLSQMLSTGEAIRACRRCGGPGNGKRCNGKAQEHQVVFAATDLFRNTHASPACISLAEMQANVGIAGKPLEPPQKGRIAAAQTKVKEYGRLNDEFIAGHVKVTNKYAGHWFSL